MAISGLQTIQVGLQNESTGSDSLYTAFTKTRDNFGILANTASPFNTFASGTGINANANTTTNTVTITNIGVTSIIAGNNITVDSSNGNVTISSTISNSTASGSNTQIQFNDAGILSGNTNFTFNKTTGVFSALYLAGNGNGLSNIQGANVSGAVTYATTANSVAGSNVSGAVTYATTANAVAGANVSGFVPNANVANTAFAVAAANVSGLGNIATINLTGNSSNVLYGNGVFAAVAGSNSSQISNGNSNVTIPISNDNVYITTNDGNSKQWIFNKDGTLRTPGNVDIYGAVNFPQQVSNINWSTYNIELSQYGRINTNVDFFANANVIGAQYLKGDGSNISNIAGANVSGQVSNALISGTVTTAAQPNITSTGTLASLSVTGNIASGNLILTTGNIIYTPRYGSFYSNATQTNPIANTAIAMTFNNSYSANGVSVVSNSRLTVAKAGVYNIQFSAQFTKTDAGTDYMEVWLSKNGTSVPWTNTRLKLEGSNVYEVASWNFVETLGATEYVQLMWGSSDLNAQIVAIPSANTIMGIDVPSVIVTVTPVGA